MTDWRNLPKWLKNIQCEIQDGSDDNSVSSIHRPTTLPTYTENSSALFLSGILEDVNQWRRAFPETYFGFTGLVKTFDLYQKMEVSPEKLVESDAPYLFPQGNK